MESIIKKFVVSALKNAIDKINGDNCELTQEQACDILSVISHEILSKEQAASFLNRSTSSFDELIRKGKLPRGKKVVGFKELMFYKDDLLKFLMIEKIKQRDGDVTSL